jgi:hypothetical protein
MGEITVAQLHEARDLWLKGWSIVRIAKYFSVTPSVIHYRLKKQFGSDVCSPLKHSLVRGLIRDGYPLETVRDMPASSQFYSSNRRDKVYTAYQDTRGTDIMDNMPAPEPSEPETRLNLTLFVLFSTIVTSIITVLISE